MLLSSSFNSSGKRKSAPIQSSRASEHPFHRQTTLRHHDLAVHQHGQQPVTELGEMLIFTLIED